MRVTIETVRREKDTVTLTFKEFFGLSISFTKEFLERELVSNIKKGEIFDIIGKRGNRKVDFWGGDVVRSLRRVNSR